MQLNTTLETRKMLIHRCAQHYMHAIKCRRASCGMPNCTKMKRVAAHTKVCVRKAAGNCLICKQLITMCCFHAKYCEDANCMMLYCSFIKKKFNETA